MKIYQHFVTIRTQNKEFNNIFKTNYLKDNKKNIDYNKIASLLIILLILLLNNILYIIKYILDKLITYIIIIIFIILIIIEDWYYYFRNNNVFKIRKTPIIIIILMYFKIIIDNYFYVINNYIFDIRSLLNLSIYCLSYIQKLIKIILISLVNIYKKHIIGLLIFILRLVLKYKENIICILNIIHIFYLILTQSYYDIISYILGFSVDEIFSLIIYPFGDILNIIINIINQLFI